ncbi:MULTISPECIES: hypothetical protein [unclassified Mycolicibacterium]|uniref:hypothetical protein n=1 Tax=unclassified Mycolicibacterium TaxID=2636767 RepID=UPI0012DDB89E|nr:MULTISPECIES: hypothetical protein [unclassified Mycolicibacterium]MUL82959.1 hypothetical protein [Mycolicibacterium sp. CBMA 329]MUL89294.1 hypothetical protein [Mycolicibacterium sp. CBMA 331]MUM02761.1 hypothetical protein [Mycolicibacterium sp. CBMA 334]MUM28917.1 hypothetical protein [Mycolicibacterium sp. CBMA 295]MUM38810.1 hypothetical protein [Mycolicibacterium sp. CBMA 247]
MTSPQGTEGERPEYPLGESQPEGPRAAPDASPSWVTAIITAVLAGIGALLTLGNGIVGLTGLVALAGDAGLRTLALRSAGMLTLTVLATLLSVVCGLLFLAGTVTLLRRKMIGRRLIVSGCVLIILGSLISLGMTLAATARYGAYSINGLAILSLVLPIATIVVAVLPSTTAWIQARQNSVAAT